MPAEEVAVWFTTEKSNLRGEVLSGGTNSNEEGYLRQGADQTRSDSPIRCRVFKENFRPVHGHRRRQVRAGHGDVEQDLVQQALLQEKNFQARMLNLAR